MKVLGRRLLFEFCESHAECRKWIANWLEDASGSQWRTSYDISKRYPAVKLSASNIIIFSVRGNDYRMEIQVAYNASVITVKWVGTHDQYIERMR